MHKRPQSRGRLGNAKLGLRNSEIRLPTSKVVPPSALSPVGCQKSADSSVGIAFGLRGEAGANSEREGARLSKPCF